MILKKAFSHEITRKDTKTIHSKTMFYVKTGPFEQARLLGEAILSLPLKHNDFHFNISYYYPSGLTSLAQDFL